MSFSSEAGYIPATIEQLMSLVREGVNEQFDKSYTVESFLGTNFYKYFYALIQRLQANEVKTSEIFLKLQEYFTTTNEMLSRPNTTAPGILDYFDTKGYTVEPGEGYFISIKPPEVGDAGKIFICVDVDEEAEDYADLKLEICGLIRDCVVGGVVSQGTESESITLSNSQSFDFKYNLPDKIPVLLKLTLPLSENNEFSIGSPDSVKAALLANIQERYRLGKNFEPQRYFSIIDAPWAESVLLEWSEDDGENWSDEVYETEYDEVLTMGLDDITIVES
jgi:hypothetical protein